jgi:transcriptional regulator with XRE-family HTH domain
MLLMAQPSPTYSGKKELVALGQTVRELRLAKGWSQEAFADYAGMDRSYVGGIERGEHNIALINLIRIASTLGLKVAQLLEKAKL